VDIVFVIGESSRPDHWQLGAYARQTNPRLSQRSNLFWLQDLITPWALTTYSVPVLMKRKPASSTEVFPEKSIVGAMREAGFETHWLANQDGLFEMNLHREEATRRKVFNLAVEREDIDAAWDGVALADLKAALAGPAARKFILVHTKGSHWDYHLRYPEAFRHFVPDRADDGGSTKHDPRQRDRLVNAYDNSIRYTDQVLDDVISALQATGRAAALVYVSDHGQALYDDGCDRFGHFNDTEISYRSAGLLWLSDALLRERPALAAALQQNRRKPLTTELTVFNTLADLAGLDIADPATSLLSERYTARSRLVNTSSGGVSFDQGVRGGACRVLGVK
jgi:glucan phosphoethanolaminetransferase (alkaline phosphatase superfamily)